MDLPKEVRRRELDANEALKKIAEKSNARPGDNGTYQTRCHEALPAFALT